ncbi:MAG: zinc-binding dehydrogenase [Kiritimatiellae bacterium]|nr:zinc-binding dehydrogenase [Kiritimatiellia bacterium]
MKAVVKQSLGEGHIALCDVPEPAPARGEVKIRVEAAGICGSDLHILHGDIRIPMRPPFVIGHEFSGVVAEVGESVEHWRNGDRVTAENSRYVCGHCRYCRTGSYNLCSERLATGYAFDGAFAGYCVVPQERVHRLPDNVDFLTGALSDPSACAFHAVQELTGIDAADNVLITGPGPMGLFCLQYAKANGAQVIVSGTARDARRLELARKLGADLTVDVDAEELEQRIGDYLNGGEVSVLLECSGKAPALQAGLRLLRRQGKYTQVGIFGAPVPFDVDQLVYKEIRVTGSFSQKYTAWAEAIRLASLGKVMARPLITHTLPLDRWREGFEAFESGEAIKVVFEP